MQEDVMKAGRGLRGSIGERVTDSAVGTRHTVVDGGGRGRRVLAGLEADVVEQGRFGKVCLGDVAGMMKVLPPAHEMQQTVGIAIEAFVGKAPDILTIQVAVDPAHALACFLFDHVNGAVRTRRCGLANHAELHGWAASRRDRNCSAFPRPTKNEFGSYPCGSATRRAMMPCAPSRWASRSAACCPLWLASTSKVR